MGRAAPRSVAEFEASYPAQFICEAIDQTRGWFYTLMAVGTLVFDSRPTRTCCASGCCSTSEGRKMSKHLGNVLEPIPLMDRHGADAVRWFMLAGRLAVDGPPDRATSVLEEMVRKVLLTYWNTASFFRRCTRARSDWAAAGRPRAERAPCTSWTGGRCSELADTRRRSRRSAGGLRLGPRPAADRGLPRRPVQLVRPALPAAVLGRASRPALGTLHSA